MKNTTKVEETPENGKESPIFRGELQMATIRFELINKIDCLENSWNQLISHMDEPEIFYKYEWVSNYVKYHNHQVNLCVAAGKTGNGELVCIFPFSYNKKVLSFITNEDTDYNSFFIDSSYNRYYITNKAIEFLLETVEVTTVRLLNAKGNSELFLLQDILKNHGFSTVLKECTIAPYRLPCDPETKIQKKTNFKRLERNLRAEHDVTFEETHELDEATIAFIQYHRRKKYGENSMDCAIDFYTHLTNDLKDETVINKLCIDGKLAAVHFGFRFGRKFYYYIPITNEEYSKYGVGLLLLKHIIEENKDLVFDFLRGNESYKFYWCDNAIMNFSLMAYKNNGEGLVPLFYEKLKNNIRIRKIFGK